LSVSLKIFFRRTNLKQNQPPAKPSAAPATEIKIVKLVPKASITLHSEQKPCSAGLIVAVFARFTLREEG